MKWSVRQFRTLVMIEGLSYLLLLFVAMPMKYLFAMPLVVRVVGMTHGLLFIGYILMGFHLSRVMTRQ